MTQWGIDTLFNPGKRHMDEEKRRLQATREEIGDSSGGRRIDLDSGTVVIPGRKKSGDEEAVETPEATTPPESDGPVATDAADGADSDEADGSAS
jgi:Family of unknown function (DUF6191)